jgi:hypothetical protein
VNFLDVRLPEGAIASIDSPRARAVIDVPGPWQHEPDRVEWRAHGFPCLIVRTQRSGHLCGYVGVEPGHPWHGVKWASYETELPEPHVHGGITFSKECHGRVCHVARPGEPERVWWHGFDALHCDDLAPEHLAIRGTFRAMADGAIYRSVEYMVRECERLAEQAAEARS